MLLAVVLVCLWAVIIVVALNLWLPFSGAAVPSILILAVVVMVRMLRLAAARRGAEDSHGWTHRDPVV